MKKLLDATAGDVMIKALIHVQYEAGTRPGELLNLKIKHVRKDEFGAIIAVDGAIYSYSISGTDPLIISYNVYRGLTNNVGGNISIPTGGTLNLSGLTSIGIFNVGQIGNNGIINSYCELPIILNPVIGNPVNNYHVDQRLFNLFLLIILVAIIYGRAESEKELLKKYPKRVEKIEDIEMIHQEMKGELKVPETGFFGGIKNWNKKRLVNKFEKNKDDPFHAGADGELRVLSTLSELSDDNYVLCGVNITLPYFVTYKCKKNLKSAQMDFVVVSKRGVILIEVKNWSRQYINEHTGFSPHEQVDRAGRVLWIALKSWHSPRNPKVTSVLLSIQGNMQFDSRYKFVSVTDLEKLNPVIENRREDFSDKDVQRIIDRLKGHVTK